MTDDALVIFTPSGKRGRFALGTPVLTAARQLGVDLDSVCGIQQILNGSASTAAATDHADAQRPHDRIESFAEQCCLPSQKRRVFVPSILTPDLDLASDNGDR